MLLPDKTIPFKPFHSDLSLPLLRTKANSFDKDTEGLRTPRKEVNLSRVAGTPSKIRGGLTMQPLTVPKVKRTD
jgi:hypothetical protein